MIEGLAQEHMKYGVKCIGFESFTREKLFTITYFIRR